MCMLCAYLLCVLPAFHCALVAFWAEMCSLRNLANPCYPVGSECLVGYLLFSRQSAYQRTGGKNFSQFSYSWLERWNCVLQQCVERSSGKRATYDTTLEHVASVNTFCYKSPFSFVETPLWSVTLGSGSSGRCQQAQIWSPRSEIPALRHILEPIKDFWNHSRLRWQNRCDGNSPCIPWAWKHTTLPIATRPRDHSTCWPHAPWLGRIVPSCKLLLVMQ